MSNQDKYTELSCNCIANERKFLDKIQEKGKWETYKTGTGIKINRETKIMQKEVENEFYEKDLRY